MNRVALVLGALALAILTVWAFRNPPVDVADVGTRVGSSEAYDPVAAGEPLPEGFRQLLPRDAIEPVYSPTFIPAEDAPWPDDAQVIGVAGGGEAKAYPVSFLNRREMVIDELAGEPILVTW